MAWSLVPQVLPVLPPSRVRLQIMRDHAGSKRLLGALLSREVLQAAGLKDGDALTLHFGQGPDAGWLRLDLATGTADTCVLSALPGTISSTIKFNLPDHTVEPVESCKAPIWEAQPGSLFVRVPAKLKGIFQAPLAVTAAAAGKAPLYSCGKAEPQEDLAPPPVEEPAAPVLAISPAAPEPSPEAPPPVAAALVPPGRAPRAKESPDHLKPEAMQQFAAGKGARAVASELEVSITLVSLWREEFDLSRKKSAPKQRAA